MSETAVLEPATVVSPPEQVAPAAAPDVNQVMAEALWTTPSIYQNIEQQPAAQTTPVVEPVITNEIKPEAGSPSQDADIIEVDDYFKKEFGMSSADFRNKWNEFNTPKETAQTQQEIQWANDDSKRFFEYLKEGKEDDVYNYLNQKKQLERLEKYDVADEKQAAEIIRANLQFKYKDLSAQEIDRLFTRQYAMPAKPTQGYEQSDEDYAVSVQAWENQVKEKQQDMIIDAKLAKPELANFKSQIVLPDIQKPQLQQQGPTQEELQAAEAGRKAYLDAVGSDYHNFKGFSITAKNGDVQLPVNYGISPEELNASKSLIENLNVDEFFGKRWFDGEKPRVNLIQEDLYLLSNRDKIFQALANDAVSKMADHLIKERNNINLSGVNPTLGPTAPKSPEQPQNVSQQVASSIWAI